MTAAVGGTGDAGSANADLRPGLSVVVSGLADPEPLATTLRSVAEQTLDLATFEVIVVVPAWSADHRRVLRQFTASQPRLAVREIWVSCAGQVPAVALGIAAASRAYVTCVASGAVLAPTLLAELYATSRPGTMAVAPVARSGELRRVRAFEIDGAKAVPTVVARAVAVADRRADLADRRADLADGPDQLADGAGQALLFWTEVLVAGRLEVRWLAPDRAGEYRIGAAADPADGTFESAVTRRLARIAGLERLGERLGERGLLPSGSPVDGSAGGSVDESAGGSAGGSAGESAGELVSELIATQAEEIGDYLAEHPAERARFVRYLDRMPISGFPYRAVNSEPARGLVIAFAFPPYVDTSAVVAAKRVRARGEMVDVLQNAMDSIRAVDHDLLRIAGPYVRRARALETPSYFADWGSMERFALAGAAIVAQWEEADGRRYEWLYSRAQFAASHVLAAVLKLANPAVTWTAEFSDPLSRDVSGRERVAPIGHGEVRRILRRGLRRRGLPVPRSRNAFVWCEEVAYALADELVFTNGNQLEYMLGYCSDHRLLDLARAKSTIAPHPTPPASFASMVTADYPLDGELVHLAYFGNLYANRGLGDVLAAAAGVPSDTRGRLRIHVFTNRPSEVENYAAELGIAEIVRVGGYLPYLEFLNLTKRFDCLIVNDVVTTGRQSVNPYLPSKWADYQLSGTPVWGLVESGSPLSQLPLAFSSPVGDVPAAIRVLNQIAHGDIGV